MRPEATDTEIIRAVTKAIVARFGQSDWIELGLLTDTLDYVKGHPRLLRSLDWNDDDYLGHVIDAVPKLLGPKRSRLSGASKFANLEEVEKYLNLPEFLRREDPALYAALYGGEDVTAVDELDAAARALGLDDVTVYAVRIRRDLHSDPAAAIGSSKELLETVLKAILGLHGNGPETNVDLPQLIKRVNVELGLDAAGEKGKDAGAEQRRRLFGALSGIVVATAELRNLGFGTGHGGVQRPELDVATARLVISSAVSLATFYIEISAASDT
ncbi:abortive infection family protein [Cellulomonas xiejunii]|uniref:Abortive infection family protein n=1 Tax=Cellulomonas xiejunii TaxID=2968083 RepID=A0ABY5KS06_9CELL|nr:abortive infection family protein [Cellulomonas xiejunii]MCC2321272.1 abortive infection family protein [Cellulomonas xiejunii]UUI71860.1 abortive infection family protein [Cellulomonas xiejunii]